MSSLSPAVLRHYISMWLHVRQWLCTRWPRTRANCRLGKPFSPKICTGLADNKLSLHLGKNCYWIDSFWGPKLTTVIYVQSGWRHYHKETRNYLPYKLIRLLLNLRPRTHPLADCAKLKPKDSAVLARGLVFKILTTRNQCPCSCQTTERKILLRTVFKCK